MSESSQLVASFEKNTKEEVRVSIDDFHGKKLVNMRVFYREGEEWKPGRQGLALSVDLYRDLAMAVAAVGEELKSRGVLR